MHYEIETKQTEATHTAVIRSRVRPDELSKFVPAACGEVWSFIRAAGLPRPGRHVAVYSGSQGTVEAGAEVAEPFAGDDRVHCSALPAGRAATTTHFGPYQHLGDAHQAIRDWCDAKRFRYTGVSWEIYGHWEDSWNADSSKIRTDVFYMIDEDKD